MQFAMGALPPREIIMRCKFLKQYPVDVTEGQIEALGILLLSAIAQSILSFILLLAHSQNGGLIFCLIATWSGFFFIFTWTFISERIAGFGLFGLGILVNFFDHGPWWLYILAPIAIAMAATGGVVVGGLIAIVILDFYKSFDKNELKVSAKDFAMTIAMHTGQTIVNFGRTDRFMPLWIISLFGRYVSIWTLIESFSAHEYSYFMTLRWIICVSCFYTALLCFKRKFRWAAVFLAISLLYNPFDIVTLTRTLWISADYFVATFLLFSIFMCPPTFGAELIKLSRPKNHN